MVVAIMADERTPADGDAPADPARTPPPPPPPPAEPGGLLGKLRDLKGVYRRWNDRRELQRQLAQLMDELEQARSGHAPAFAELGRSIVEADLLGHPDLAELPAARTVYDLQSRIAAHRSEIEQLQVAQTADEELIAGWVAGWQQRLDADEQSLRAAESDLETARGEHADADRAVRDMLRGRVEQMRGVGARLTQAAQQIESVPESTSLQQMDDLAHATSQLASLLHDRLHGLPAAIERLLASRPRLGEAERVARVAADAVESRRGERAAKQKEALAAAEAKRREAAAIEQRIASLGQEIAREHAALGTQAAERLANHQVQLDLPAAPAALAAVTDERQQQRRISELSKQIESMV